jgi:hypothetical protein
MNVAETTSIRAEASRGVRQQICEFGIVNVPAVSEEIKRQHPAENIFDIERLILGYAMWFGAPIVFDRSLIDPPVCIENAGLLIDFVPDDCEMSA